MAQSNKSAQKAPKVQEAPANEVKTTQKTDIHSFKFQAIIIALLSIVFYANTFKNEYAFDDMMAIVNNDYVHKGFGGIGEIMTNDAYKSYLKNQGGDNQLAGGRYRPLSLVTFAIEQQILGLPEDAETGNSMKNRSKDEEQKLISDMHFRHVVNVLLYALCGVVLLYFLRTILFKNQPWVAFVATVLFTIHPLHTEVVANVKSRDEILSVIFICLTFIYAFKFFATQKRNDLIKAGSFYFLALLSKEYAITLLVLLPLSFYLFGQKNPVESVKGLLPYLIPFGIYMALRMSSVNGPGEEAAKNVMNYPYLYATGVQKLASEIEVLFRYLKLLVLPYPLSADYSFKQIPYSDFSNPMVLFSLVIHFGLIALTGWALLKRKAIAFPLAFYLLNLALISNFLVNIGAPMGERLVFHSSIGFAVILAQGLHLLSAKLKINAPSFTGGVLVALSLFSGAVTINRNADWMNNSTLFLADVKTCPNSVLANTNAGSACMGYAKDSRPDTTASNKWFREAISYFSKALNNNPDHGLAYTNRGLCYFNLGLPDSAVNDWAAARAKGFNTPMLNQYTGQAVKMFLGQGNAALQSGNNTEAVRLLTSAVKIAPSVPDGWQLLGVAYKNSGNIEEAKKAFQKCLLIAPGNNVAQAMLNEMSAH